MDGVPGQVRGLQYRSQVSVAGGFRVEGVLPGRLGLGPEPRSKWKEKACSARDTLEGISVDVLPPDFPRPLL
jgi:hypothetical protein